MICAVFVNFVRQKNNRIDIMETVVSGIRSTGQLHLGNYFGALKNFVKMQHTDRCFFFIADYHSLTTHPDPKALHGNVRNVLAEYLAAGLDPDEYTGFYVNIGLDRLVMMRYGVDDVRLFHSADLRFLKQFR